MTEEQFERLLQAIERNTAVQAEVAESQHRLADECANLVALLVDQPTENDADAKPALDMAGRPIRQT